MVWNRNEGQNKDEIVQNKFTAYLLCAVKRRKALYIDHTVREMQAMEKIGDAFRERNLFWKRKSSRMPLFI